MCIRDRHLSTGILAGITRHSVLELARELSMEIEEKPNVEVWELLSADEIFLSHTSRGIEMCIRDRFL